MKESHQRVNIGSESRPVYVQSIYVPSLLGLGQEIRTVEVCGSDEANKST